VAQLEQQLQKAESSSQAALRMKGLVDRHHEDIRSLLLGGNLADPSLRSRLLQELQLVDQQLETELPERSRRKSTTGPGTHSRDAIAANKASATNLNGAAGPQSSHKEVDALKHQVQALEVQLAASDKVRRHLESSMKDLSRDLEVTDVSKQSLQKYRLRLAKENERLAQLLDEEAEARRTAETQHANGLQAMWGKFEKTIANERANYSRAEESRKALVCYSYSVLFPSSHCVA
jgi:myosin protein heavy chain